MNKVKREINPVLTQTQKPESIGNLPGGIAREFSNILSIILGHTQLSLSEDITPDIKKSLTEIEKAAMHGSSLVQKITASLSSETIKAD